MFFGAFLMGKRLLKFMAAYEFSSRHFVQQYKRGLQCINYVFVFNEAISSAGTQTVKKERDPSHPRPLFGLNFFGCRICF